jgi:hypothetical protein
MVENLSENWKYLFFLGQGRTGSTLQGQLLNSHPNICVSHEQSMFKKSVREKTRFTSDHYLCEIIEASKKQVKTGLENYESKNYSVWQRKWNPIKHNIIKNEIKYIGDKSGYCNSSMLQSKSGRNKKYSIKLFNDALEKNQNIVTVMCIRSPSLTIMSNLKIHKDIKNIKNLQTRINNFVIGMLESIEFCEAQEENIFLNYDLLCTDTKSWINKFETDFNLDCSEEWKCLVHKTTCQMKKLDLLINKNKLNDPVSGLTALGRPRPRHKGAKLLGGPDVKMLTKAQVIELLMMHPKFWKLYYKLIEHGIEDPNINKVLEEQNFVKSMKQRDLNIWKNIKFTKFPSGYVLPGWLQT